MKHLLKACSFVAVLGFLASDASASATSIETTLTLDPDGATDGIYGHKGQAGTIDIQALDGMTNLGFSLSGLTPDSVYSVWLLLDTAQSPFVSGTCPNCVARDANTGTLANVYGFSPGAPDNAGYTAGNGIDPNGFVADADGNATFTINLNYDIFQADSAPLVLRAGTTESVAVMPMPGTCVGLQTGDFPAAVDSGFMRVYDPSIVANLPAVSPAYEVLDGKLKPRLVRGTVTGFEIAEHFDGLTHGHRPGLHIGNPAASTCGDWEGRLTGNLANAMR